MAKSKYENYTKEQLIEKVKLLEKQRYGLVWEDKPEEIADQCERELPVLTEVKEKEIINNTDKPTNFIFEGDNYHTLFTLNFTHRKKIDLIYIDPPYNTGSKNWKYNNNYVDKLDPFRHSKWLSFMAKRLRLAKRLLTSSGVLVCAIDKHEHATLVLLLKKIFVGYDVHSITVMHNPRGTQGDNFSYTHEYAVFVLPKGQKVITPKSIEEEEVSWSNLRNWGGESLRSDARNCFYPITINPKTCEIISFGNVSDNDFHPSSSNIENGEFIDIYPIDGKKVERKWRYAQQSVEEVRDLLRVRKKSGKWDIEIGKDYGIHKTIWDNPKYDANEFGTKILKSLVPKSDFDFPKSLYTVYDCIYAVTVNNKNAVILDFFAGSGTTGHAVLKMNEDGGNRQFILCTNNEVGDKSEKIFKEKHQITEKQLSIWKRERKKEWVEWSSKYGICATITYPRIKALLNGNEEFGQFKSHVKYYKTDYVPYVITDNDKRTLVSRSTELLCISENTFDIVTQNEKQGFSIFKSSEQFTAIIYDEDSIQRCCQEIIKINPTHRFIIYVFSYDHTYDEADFETLKFKFIVKPIPEAILNVYRKISKLKRK